ncbi:hypothetical protein [Paenibacillus koleovorans]|uniref:hypothetical protein n=1 Tax=Paenibacillus koleovorans TaxID=121608 RepID=UPI000FDA19A2|nr:hypothetical protein [Paenibacillus koleovorans]
MQEVTNREILEELKKIQQKLEALSEPKGLSTPGKILALIFGFAVFGPLLGYLASIIINLLS